MKKVEEAPPKMQLGGKNFKQMVEQLTPEEISATFS
jgi:hypothetical protein